MCDLKKISARKMESYRRAEGLAVKIKKQREV